MTCLETYIVTLWNVHQPKQLLQVTCSLAKFLPFNIHIGRDKIGLETDVSIICAAIPDVTRDSKHPLSAFALELL